jgi:inverse autotransporter-like protein with beta domain
VFSRIFLSAALVMSGPVSVVAAEGDKWTPYVDVEGKLGTDRNLGEVGLFVPLGQSQDSLLFGNLITRFDDQDSFEGNVGLGYREIVDGNYILGGYAFFDRRKSASDNYFNQVMAGAEFMTDVWTVRANGYFADNDLAPTSGGVVTQSGTQIFVQSNLEGALSGFDAEVGRVIPLGLEDVTLTGFAGGFHFGRSGFEDVSGPRGRAELSFNNLWDTVLPSGTQLRFGAEVQHDDVRDTQGFFSARLRVPLFGGSSSSSLSTLEQRMVDPVVRDIDVVAGGTLSAPVAPTLRGAMVQGASIVNGNDDLGAALTAAGPGSIVIVDGSNGPVKSAGGATVQSGQVVVGAQSAQFQFTDPTTGQMIVWSPTPDGVRPTVQGVLLGLPSDGVISGIDLSSSLVLPAGGGASFNASNIFDLVLTGNALAGGTAQCVAFGNNLVGGLNSALAGGLGVPLANPTIAGGSQFGVTNLAQLTQLNLQLSQAQMQNCIP